MRASIPIVIATALLIAPVAAADHGGKAVTVHCKYVDGHKFDCEGQPPTDPSSVQASIIDDLWGPGVVAGFLCTDENANDVCGETDEGEVARWFCGDSAPVAVPPSPDLDAVAVFVGGPIAQAQHCDATEAPTGGTTGGVLNPGNGVFLTFK